MRNPVIESSDYQVLPNQCINNFPVSELFVRFSDRSIITINVTRGRKKSDLIAELRYLANKLERQDPG